MPHLPHFQHSKNFTYKNSRFKGALAGLRHCFATESALKMIKSSFYFTLKVLFILKNYRLLSWPFGYAKNGWIRNIKLISKFMTSQPEKKTIVIQILPNISRSNSNQKTKCVYCNNLLIKLWLHEIKLTFLIKPFSLRDQKVKTKISWELNELLRWN